MLSKPASISTTLQVLEALKAKVNLTVFPFNSYQMKNRTMRMDDDHLASFQRWKIFGQSVRCLKDN